MNKYRVYTGPTLVDSAAQRLTSAGLTVLTVGTEHVYVNALDVPAVLAVLNAPYNSGWTSRDVQAL